MADRGDDAGPDALAGEVAESHHRAGTAMGENMTLQNLRLAAVNIDGVLLSDSFTPVIRKFIVERGGLYTAEIERDIISQSDEAALRVLAKAAGIPWEIDQVERDFYTERDDYLRTEPISITDGAEELLQRLRALRLSAVCYGGTEREHFERHLASLRNLFEPPYYVCTADFRPGLVEVAEAFNLAPCQVLFIDDVARVGEQARDCGAGFVGYVPKSSETFQGKLMGSAGVRYRVHSLENIDEWLIRRVDAEITAGTFWN
ncbi:beta-phosphoglucomutase-like phosphatase (HAD superfamily) [Streptomyces sp. V4I8]|uniref:HAD family phosphatase n=1 Tax=Streptomyces sp. V4I8 TaxID=3156469 RepID=UPI0035198745